MDCWLSLSAPMVLARLAGAKTCTRRLVTRANSLVDGRVATAEEWARLDWTQYAHDRTTWWVDRAKGVAHPVTPRIQPGDDVCWREGTHAMPAGFVRYDADNALVMEGKDAAGWLKQDGSPYKVSSLAPRYMPHAWCRLHDEVVSVTPSTPADVNTPEEARAEGLLLEEVGGYEVENAWTWRGPTAHPMGYGTPAEAFAALLRELHGAEVPTDAPMWRIAWR
jgi:hypothetical protein